MTTQMDSAFGLKKEVVYGTYIAPDKFYEFLEEDFNWVPTFNDTVAQRYGQRFMAADRRLLIREETTGSVTVETATKGLGALFEAALGTGTSTLVAGTAYQQLFVPTDSGPLPSYTIQKSIPLVGGGAAQPQSYVGNVCTGFELTADNSSIPQLTFSWMGKTVTTSQAFVTPSYPTNYTLLSFVHGTIRVGGVVTPPTTTALAVGGTAICNVLDISLTYENNLDDGGFFICQAGQRGRPAVIGMRSISGSMTVEYDTNTLRDAFLAQTDLALVLQFKHTTLISGTSYPTLEITVPLIRLDGEMPKANGGEVITQTVDFTGLDGRVAAQTIYVAIVTAETAI